MYCKQSKKWGTSRSQKVCSSYKPDKLSDTESETNEKNHDAYDNDNDCTTDAAEDVAGDGDGADGDADADDNCLGWSKSAKRVEQAGRWRREHV